jgi:hypothetical protein
MAAIEVGADWRQEILAGLGLSCPCKGRVVG